MTNSINPSDITPIQSRLELSPKGKARVEIRDEDQKIYDFAVKQNLNPLERKTEKLLSKVGKQRYVLLNIKDEHGVTQTVYANVNSVAKGLGISREKVIEFAKAKEGLGLEARLEAKAIRDSFSRQAKVLQVHHPQLSFIQAREVVKTLHAHRELISSFESGKRTEFEHKIEGLDVTYVEGKWYVKDKHLGEGANKTVDLYHDLVEGRPFPLAKTKEGHRPSKTEVAALEVLKGKRGIVGFHGVTYISEDFGFKKEEKAGEGILLDFYNAGELEDHIGDEEVQGQRYEIALDLLNGLAATHEAKIVQRDLKPENILLNKGEDGKYQAVIADFGEALLPGASDPKLKGTRTYFTREKLLQDDASVRKEDLVADHQGSTAADDVYNLGQILFKLFYQEDHPLVDFLTERFQLTPADESPDISKQEIDRVVQDPFGGKLPEPITGTPEHVIWQMLHPDPEARPSAGEALAAFLRVVRQG